VTNSRLCLERWSDIRKPYLHADLLSPQKLARNHRSHSTLAEIDASPGKVFGHSRTQYNHIYRDLDGMPDVNPA
jgi:hypothetical protein